MFNMETEPLSKASVDGKRRMTSNGHEECDPCKLDIATREPIHAKRQSEAYRTRSPPASPASSKMNLPPPYTCSPFEPQFYDYALTLPCTK
ncbi:hypothetical protein VNO77_22815 [Canavalia gladiata]|uniref:Uncharacterized protein n=1 Tax=Canavalia gladiata TaxID=3824 RepID=A0AAN9QET9_CANGL